MGRDGDSSKSSIKSAVAVAGAFAFGWLAIELAFKPFLDRFRGAIDNSDPARDPDDEQDPDPATTKSSSDDGPKKS